MAASPEKAEIVIVGAGFAGAATAYALTRRGVSDIVILEQETRPGAHSSGLHAGLGREVVTSADLLPLVVEGMRFLNAPPERFPAHRYLRVTGSLIIAGEPIASIYRDTVVSLRAHGLAADWIERADVERLVPLTAGGDFTGGVHCRQDGIIDVVALLDGYLRAAVDAGARLMTQRRALGIGVSDRTVTYVDTEQGRIYTPVVVNAAGAWAAEIALRAGASAIQLRPSRRHVALSGPISNVNTDWPFVWDESNGIYFRPEPPGLLISACDETEHPPGPVIVDPTTVELLTRKIACHMPALQPISFEHTWAGLRVLTPDGNFVIGRDPKVRGFIWCAGLGDHGATASAAAGRLAAQSVLGGEVPDVHAPLRFEADTAETSRSS